MKNKVDQLHKTLLHCEFDEEGTPPVFSGDGDGNPTVPPPPPPPPPDPDPNHGG